MCKYITLIYCFSVHFWPIAQNVAILVSMGFKFYFIFLSLKLDSYVLQNMSILGNWKLEDILTNSFANISYFVNQGWDFLWRTLPSCFGLHDIQFHITHPFITFYCWHMVHLLKWYHFLITSLVLNPRKNHF